MCWDFFFFFLGSPCLCKLTYVQRHQSIIADHVPSPHASCCAGSSQPSFEESEPGCALVLDVADGSNTAGIQA